MLSASCRRSFFGPYPKEPFAKAIRALQIARSRLPISLLCAAASLGIRKPLERHCAQLFAARNHLPYFVYFRAQTLIQQLLTNAAVYGAQIKGTAYPVYLFGSVGVGDVRASIIVSAAVSTLFSLMWVLLSHSFLQIATAPGKVARREYRETRSRQRSTNTALLCREFSRFAASPSYILNCGLGTFLMPVCRCCCASIARQQFTPCTRCRY